MTTVEREAMVKAGYDVDGALARFVNNEPIYVMFLKKLETDENYSKIEPSVSAGDYVEAYKAVHALKGIVGNLGITDEFECTKDILALIKDKTVEDVPVSDVMPLVQKLKECHDNACAIIRGIS